MATDEPGSDYQPVDKPWIPPELVEPYKEERREKSPVDFDSIHGVWTATYEDSRLRTIGRTSKIHDQALYAARDLNLIPSDLQFNFSYHEHQVRKQLMTEGFMDEGEKHVKEINMPAPLIDEIDALTDFWFDYDVDHNNDVISFYGVDLQIRDQEGDIHPNVKILAYLSGTDADTGIEWDEGRGRFTPFSVFARQSLQSIGLISGTSTQGYRLRTDLPPGMEDELEELVGKSGEPTTPPTNRY